jgi:hypothetical protein
MHIASACIATTNRMQQLCSAHPLRASETFAAAVAAATIASLSVHLLVRRKVGSKKFILVLLTSILCVRANISVRMPFYIIVILK